MEAKIKMPEELAEKLSQNESEMIFFNSLSFDEKKEYIQSHPGVVRTN